MAVSEIKNVSEYYLYAVKEIINRWNHTSSAAFRRRRGRSYFFNVIARKSTVRFHASAASAAR
jgi:hypothetical protein